MSETKTHKPKNHPRVIHAPPQSFFASKKVKPYASEEQLHSAQNDTVLTSRNVPFISPPHKSQPTHLITRTASPTNNELTSTNALFTSTPHKSLLNHATSKPASPTNKELIDETKTSGVSISMISKLNLSENSETNLIKEKPQSPNPSKGCCSHPTSKEKLPLILTIVILGFVIVAAAVVIPPVYLFVIQQQPIQQSSLTNISVSACSATTCIGKETPYHTSMLTVMYPFDGNPSDLSGYYTGVGLGLPSPSYSSNSYIGYNTIQLNIASFQYVQIPYINLAQQSFTLELWVYIFTYAYPSDLGIFSQCDSNSVCFLLTLRNGHITLSFDSMNENNNTLIGSTMLNPNAWYHIAVVYNAVLFQQQIYVNGRSDAVSRGIVAAYQGSSYGTVTTIGRSVSLAAGHTYFNGRLDQFAASAGFARTACQIYNDASLLAFYPFDTTGTFNDYSVNYLNGLAIGTTSLSKGRLNQAIYFPSNTSFFQALAYASVRTVNTAFSFSLWVNPASVGSGGSLVHVSSLQNGSGIPCYDLLAFTSTGAVVAQVMISVYFNVSGAQGPILPINTWTHVVVIYGQTNGLRLFINGQVSASSASVNNMNIQDQVTPLWVTLGTNSPWGVSSTLTCGASPLPIISGQFIGGVDQFRVYNRELDTEELCVLVNI